MEDNYRYSMTGGTGEKDKTALQENQIDADGWCHKVDIYCSVHECPEVAIEYYPATILGLLFKLPLCKKHFEYLTDECEGPIK